MLVDYLAGNDQSICSRDECHELICYQHKNAKHQMAHNFGMVASRVEDTKNPSRSEDLLI